MKLAGVFAGSEKDIVCKFINFSKGRKAYTGMHIYPGIWRDRLRFVNVDGGEIRAWALWDGQEDEWTLVCNVLVFFLHLNFVPRTSHHVLLDYILYKMRFFLYI